MDVTDPDDLGGLAERRSPLQMTIVRSRASTRLAAAGELDIATASRLEGILLALKGLVVLDLREIDFIDSTGLRLLLRADARARRDGTDLRLLCGDAVRRLLQLTGTHDRFAHADGEELERP